MCRSVAPSGFISNCNWSVKVASVNRCCHIKCTSCCQHTLYQLCMITLTASWDKLSLVFLSLCHHIYSYDYFMNQQSLCNSNSLLLVSSHKQKMVIMSPTHHFITSIVVWSFTNFILNTPPHLRCIIFKPALDKKLLHYESATDLVIWYQFYILLLKDKYFKMNVSTLKVEKSQD